MMRSFARFPAVALLAFVAHGQHVVWTFTGSVGDESGAALLATADQNNDGYTDVLVGAPGWNGSRGYVRALSGKFLATGSGSAILWTYFHSVSTTGARAGSSLVEVGTLTGNIATDYVVGVPGDAVGAVNNGGLLLIDGSTHAFAHAIFGDPNTRLGASIAAVGDQDGDGKVEIVVTAPSTNGSASWVHVISGAAFAMASQFLSNLPHSSINSNTSSLYGAVVASGFDLDHDGRFDVAIGSPDFFGHGVVQVFRADGSWTPLGIYNGQGTERMGASIDGTMDFDGDGYVDFVVGAPNWSLNGTNQDGRVVVLSGHKLLLNQPPEMLDLHFGNTAPANNHFGTCVRASADLNGDGVADVLAGAPDYAFHFIGGSINRGALAAFSGASGARFGFLSGVNFDHLGDALLGAGADLNGDGFPEFAVAGSLSNNATTDCGTVKFCSLFPSFPSSYCTSKTNSLGCAPSMGSTGFASLSSSAAFTVSCFNAINQTSGLFFYAHHPNATPFQGGTMCVGFPLRRTALINAGGSASGADCSGVLQFDFKTHLQSGADATLVAGSEVFLQCWSRDPASASTTSLSNAVRFLVNP
jgi:hypothetical protein